MLNDHAAYALPQRRSDPIRTKPDRTDLRHANRIGRRARPGTRALGFSQEQAPGVGKHDVASVAIEQAHVKFVFQLANLAA